MKSIACMIVLDRIKTKPTLFIHRSSSCHICLKTPSLISHFYKCFHILLPYFFLLTLYTHHQILLTVEESPNLSPCHLGRTWLSTTLSTYFLGCLGSHSGLRSIISGQSSQPQTHCCDWKAPEFHSLWHHHYPYVLSFDTDLWSWNWAKFYTKFQTAESYSEHNDSCHAL